MQISKCASLAGILLSEGRSALVYRRKLQFNAFKFRTMHVNGDEFLASFPDLHKEPALNHKIKNDPRITRLGIFLRKTSLQELPQLINVLQGNMSLVGRRIIPPEEVRHQLADRPAGHLTSKTRRNSPHLHCIEQVEDMHLMVEHF